MAKLQIDVQKAYGYPASYLEKKTKELRERFRQACLQDNTLSEEFRKHVEDANNINVEIEPRFGIDLALDLMSVSVDYSYEYSLVYTSSTSYSGTGRETSSGTIKVDLTEHKSYSSSKEIFHGNHHYFVGNFDPCEVHLGDSIFKPDPNFVDFTEEEDFPKEFNDLAEKISFETIKELFTVNHLPERNREIIQENCLRYAPSDARNFRLERITDCLPNTVSLVCFPKQIDFCISVRFDSTTYELTGATNVYESAVGNNENENLIPDDVHSIGPKSEHYIQFTEMVDQQKQKYSLRKSGSKTCFLTLSALFFLNFLWFLILYLVSPQIGHAGLRVIYFEPAIILMVLNCIASFISLCFCLVCTKQLNDVLHLFSESKTLPEMQREVSDSFQKDRKKYNSGAMMKIGVLAILLLVWLGGSIYLTVITKNPDFYYAPEMIREYTYISRDGTEEVWTINSCSKDGDIEAIMESGNRQHFVKISYNGKLVKRDNKKVYVEFKIDEILDDPGNAASVADNNFTAIFSENFTIMRTDLNNREFKSDTQIYDRDLATKEILNKYEYRGNTFEVLSCKKNGEVVATYIQKATEKDGEDSVFRLTGQVTYKKTNGIILVEFTDKELISGSNSKNDLHDMPYAYFYSDFSKVDLQSIWTYPQSYTFNLITE